MRYCFVLPNFDEDQNSFSKLLAPIVKELLAAGDSVTILSGNNSYRGKYQFCHRVIPGPRSTVAFVDYCFLVAFSSLWLKFNRAQFDVIHNLGVGTTVVHDVLTAHACHRAWVQTKWELQEYFSLFFNPLHLIVLLVEGFNYRRNTPVIAVCQGLADDITRYYPYVKNRLTVINNGIPNLESKTSLKRLDQGGSRKFIISFASNDHRKKGLGELIGALKLARKNRRLWHLVILGKDKKELKWQKLVAKLRLTETVTFVGHVLNLRDHLLATDIFCLPSRYEPFGLVFLEASQSGLPVVGTRVGIYPVLAGHEFSKPPLRLPIALPIKVKDLYESLAALQDDENLRRALAEECQAAAVQFSEQAMVEKTLNFYLQFRSWVNP